MNEIKATFAHGAAEVLHEVKSPVVKRGESPSTVTVEGDGMSDIIAQYAAADDALKAAEDRKKEIRKLLTPLLLEALFSEARKAKKPATSIDVHDKTGAVLQFQLQAVYPDLDQDSIVLLSEVLDGSEIAYDEVVDRKTTVTFDPEVFQSHGVWDGELYEEFEKAVAKVCEQLRIEVPLSRGTSHKIRKQFHLDRLKALSVEDNLRLQAHMPAKGVVKVKRDKNAASRGWNWLKNRIMG